MKVDIILPDRPMHAGDVYDLEPLMRVPDDLHERGSGDL